MKEIVRMMTIVKVRDSLNFSVFSKFAINIKFMPKVVKHFSRVSQKLLYSWQNIFNEATQPLLV